MSEKAKFEAGTYSADDILDWYDLNTNEVYIDSLKKSDRSVFDDVIEHEDDGVIYEIGTVDGVSVIIGEKKKPEIFGQDIDTLGAAGEKSLSALQATPEFLADMLNPKNIAKGMNQGVVNAFQLVDSLTGGSVTKLDNYFTENFPNTLGKKIEYKQPEGAGGVTGSIIGQYVAPGIGLLKLLRGSVLLSEPLLVGAFSSKDEGNMANLFKDMFPDFTQNNEAANIIINGLIADEDDSEVIGRLKNIAADSPIAFAFEGIFKIYKSLFKNKEAIEEIKSVGAAATPKDAPTPVEVVDSSGQTIKQADQVVQSEKPFYSNVEKTISNFTFKQQPGNQILATLNNTAGIKQSEIQDLGLDTFLKDKPSVTKEELDDFIADKSLVTRINETVLDNTKSENLINFRMNDDAPDILKDTRNAQEAEMIVMNNEYLYNDLLNYHKSKNPDYSPDNITPDDIEDYLGNVHGMVEVSEVIESKAKFASYVEPGGDNYKEMLISVPGTPQVFTKHHFSGEVPSGENLVAHARFNDRTIDGQKILFIEEIQSDLHQKARKVGYNNKQARDEFEKYSQELAAKYDLNPNQNLAMYGTMKKMTVEEINKYNDLQAQVNFDGIADAPFKKNWYELTMKRLIKYAVDNGYDGIAFTSGDMQVARYAGMDNAEGLKGFYDNTLTKFTNKFSKKYGAELEQSTLKSEINNPDEIVKGRRYRAGNQAWYIKGNDKQGYELMNAVEGDVTETVDFYDTLDAAKKDLIEEIEGFYQDRKVPLLIFPQNMKDQILTEGVPIAQVEERENKQQTTAIV